jgi:hypothetical protein
MNRRQLLDTRTEANLNQVAGDVHFLTAPMRLLWHALLWLIFLLLAPAIFAIVPVLALRYASPDEIWLLKWAFGVLGHQAADVANDFEKFTVAADWHEDAETSNLVKAMREFREMVRQWQEEALR